MGELRISLDGETYRLRQRQTLVGRSRRCTIVLSSQLASREHCVLERSGANITLVELGSKNGTWVNGERVSRRRQLIVGDKIRIGSDQMEVVENLRMEEHRPPGAQTQRMPRGPSNEVFEDAAAATVEHGSILELAEVLIETAATLEQRPQTTRVIQSAVDELLDHAGLTQPYLSPTDEQRLRVIADRVQAWWTDGSVDAWRKGLEGRLVAAARRR